MTLEEIGETFDLTRERVRQIKEKAIKRLKHKSVQTLKRDIHTMQEFIDKHPSVSLNFKNYHEHMKCEYAERIGRKK